jgi:hypothetical protein
VHCPDRTAEPNLHFPSCATPKDCPTPCRSRAAPTTPRRPARAGISAAGIGFIIWDRLDRASGTRQDGVWQGTATLSPAWFGTYAVDFVQVDDDQNGQFPFTVKDGPTITVSGGERWARASTSP